MVSKMYRFFQKNRSIYASSLMALIIFSFSQPISIADDLFDDDQNDSFSFIPGKPWQEADLPVPDSPTDDSLVPLEIYQMPDYKYYIDIKSLNVSGGDNVVRYTAVLETPSGIRNVFFEGIRCDNMTYKLYASALWGQPLKKTFASEWRNISVVGVNVYRNDLFRYFLCSQSIINGKKSDIVQMLKYPPTNFIIEDED